MCNEFERDLSVAEAIKRFAKLKTLPPFEWRENRIPNDQDAKPSIKIGDQALVVSLDKNKLSGQMMTWAWKTPKGKPVFNFVSDGRDFSQNARVLIPATGFYEYTAPQNPKIKLKDRHLFKLKDGEWFWIAGIEKHNCFSMLTTKPGPDIAPYHDRQICVLPPGLGMSWLKLDKSEQALLQPMAQGTLAVVTLRKNGELSDNAA